MHDIARTCELIAGREVLSAVHAAALTHCCAHVVSNTTTHTNTHARAYRAVAREQSGCSRVAHAVRGARRGRAAGVELTHARRTVRVSVRARA
jgi:hypothetical protein